MPTIADILRELAQKLDDSFLENRLDVCKELARIVTAMLNAELKMRNPKFVPKGVDTEATQ